MLAIDALAIGRTVLVDQAKKKAPVAVAPGRESGDLTGTFVIVSSGNNRKPPAIIPGCPGQEYKLCVCRHAPAEFRPYLSHPQLHRHAQQPDPPFLIHWAITAVSLWVASHLFRGLKFDGTGALVVSALLLGLANAVVKPLLIVLTLPLTLVTFGLFLLVINALMILLVAALVKGFRVSGFWTALFASIFISLLSIVIGSFVTSNDPAEKVQMPQSGNWL
jgi:putative membrane protein